jgi:hypothetical protein
VKIKHTLLFALAVVFSTSCLGQVRFKEGYFIDKGGNKTECFIEDRDWGLAPESITYRLTGSGENQKIEVEKLSEFAIPGRKFINIGVQYDKSSQALKDLSVLSNPDWAQGDLLLKVIVDGKAKLYQYTSKNSTLYFFGVDQSPIEQLVFKEFIRPDKNAETGFNRTYLSQLNTLVNCGLKAPVTGRQVPYSLGPLTKHFKNFNLCSGEAPVEEVEPPVKTFTVVLHRALILPM